MTCRPSKMSRIMSYCKCCKSGSIRIDHVIVCVQWCTVQYQYPSWGLREEAADASHSRYSDRACSTSDTLRARSLHSTESLRVDSAKQEGQRWRSLNYIVNSQERHTIPVSPIEDPIRTALETEYVVSRGDIISSPGQAHAPAYRGWDLLVSALAVVNSFSEHPTAFRAGNCKFGDFKSISGKAPAMAHTRT
jgi:hypothetical protein